MPRLARVAPGGWFYHVLNRANGFETLFRSETEYFEFVRMVARCAADTRMRIVAWCAMPNHWHFLLWPRNDEDLFRFVHRLTLRHTKRWHSRNDTVGRGHLYQGRYKSFVVQDDRHLMTVCRYIERTPVRARLVSHAADWQWSSARTRVFESDRAANRTVERSVPPNVPVALEALPVDRPGDWWRWLCEDIDGAALDRIRTNVTAGLPFGNQEWTAAAAETLGVPATLRRRGRPPRQSVEQGTNLGLDLRPVPGDRS